MAGIIRPRQSNKTGARANRADRLHSRRKPTVSPRGVPPVMVRNRSQDDLAVSDGEAGDSSNYRHSARKSTVVPTLTSRSSRGRANARGKETRQPFAAAGRPRRRYDLTLNVPGAEVRLPSMPSLHLSWRVASGFLCLCMAACLYLMLFSPVFQVDVVQVEGLQRLTFEDVYPALTIIGEPLVLVNPESVTQELREVFPEFASIMVKVYLPARIKLDITERQPVIAWIQDGQERWVDDEGMAFPPRGQPGKLVRVEAEGLPTGQIDNLIPQLATTSTSGNTPLRLSEYPSFPLIPRELVAAIVAISPYLPEGVPLLYTRERGMGWVDPRGWSVFFGSGTEQIDQKLIVYQALSEQIARDGIQPSLISMEFLYAPYYRR